MKKGNEIFIVWGIIIVALISVLILIGAFVKKNAKHYEVLENKLSEAAEVYVGEESIILEEDSKIKITSKDLIKEGYLDELKYKKDTCVGYVEVTFDKVYNYKAYIDCQNYQTLNYK